MDLGERIVSAVPAGFYVHGGEDVLIGGVAPIVRNEIVLPYGGEIAKRLNRASGVAEPGMPVHAEVPKMAMRVDDRSAVQSRHTGSPEIQLQFAGGPASAIALPFPPTVVRSIMQRA